MTAETLPAALLRDVPRYGLTELGPVKGGQWMHCADVLAALSRAMSDDLAERAGKVLEGVTPGPWHVGQDDGVPFVGGAGRVRADLIGPEGDRLPNARFIAAARELVPALLAQNAALRAALDEAEARILAALEPVDAPKTVVMETPPVRYCPICDIADCATHREPVAAPEPAAIREAALREAAALMAVAAENCRKQFTYPPKTKEQRNYQTGAIIHSNAAAAILALIPTKGAAE